MVKQIKNCAKQVDDKYWHELDDFNKNLNVMPIQLFSYIQITD